MYNVKWFLFWLARDIGNMAKQNNNWGFVPETYQSSMSEKEPNLLDSLYAVVNEIGQSERR